MKNLIQNKEDDIIRTKNASEVLDNVIWLIEASEEGRRKSIAEGKTGRYPKWNIRLWCDELNIFDWWKDDLSISQLRQMADFLRKAIIAGYDGYVCFKVGAAGCSHGMWAYKEESTTGYSPDGEVLFHSFRRGDNYWDIKNESGEWMDPDGSKKMSWQEIERYLIA